MFQYSTLSDYVHTRATKILSFKVHIWTLLVIVSCCSACQQLFNPWLKGDRNNTLFFSAWSHFKRHNLHQNRWCETHSLFILVWLWSLWTWWQVLIELDFYNVGNFFCYPLYVQWDFLVHATAAHQVGTPVSLGNQCNTARNSWIEVRCISFWCPEGHQR